MVGIQDLFYDMACYLSNQTTKSTHPFSLACSKDLNSADISISKCLTGSFITSIPPILNSSCGACNFFIFALPLYLLHRGSLPPHWK